jgi:hypothetical protein
MGLARRASFLSPTLQPSGYGSFIQTPDGWTHSVLASGGGVAHQEFKPPTRLPRALRPLAHKSVVHQGPALPSVELEPSPPSAGVVVLAGRAPDVPLSSSPQRSPRVNTGQRANSLTCASAGQRAARQCFPSSRWSG